MQNGAVSRLQALPQQAASVASVTIAAMRSQAQRLRARLAMSQTASKSDYQASTRKGLSVTKPKASSPPRSGLQRKGKLATSYTAKRSRLQAQPLQVKQGRWFIRAAKRFQAWMPAAMLARLRQAFSRITFLQTRTTATSTKSGLTKNARQRRDANKS